MYMDNNLLISGSVSAAGVVTGQTVTGTGNVLSANTVDLGTNRDIGSGAEYPILQLLVTTAFAGATSVEFQAVTADDAALSVNVTTLGTTGAIPVASLIAGKRMAVDLSTQVGSKGQRYIGGRYIITGTGTAGVLVGFFGADIQDGQKFYASGFQVS